MQQEKGFVSGPLEIKRDGEWGREREGRGEKEKGALAAECGALM